MEQLAHAGSPPQSRSGGLAGLAWIGGAVASVIAAGVAIVLAVFFAATLVVVGLIAAALIVLVAVLLRARRAMRPKDPTLIEARHVGGHSWVAYGWDQRGR